MEKSAGILNRIYFRLLLVAIILTSSFYISAQDIQFSQFYAVPVYQNPAFAGSLHNFRATAAQRMQWLGFSNSKGFFSSLYNTSLVSVDHYFEKYRSGAGLMVMKDVQGGVNIASVDVQGVYSYELPISNTFTARGGLQLGYVSRDHNYSALRFPSNYNDTTGFNGVYGSNTYGSGRDMKNFLDVSSGAVIYSDRLWVGIAAHHMNTPNQSYIKGVNTLPAVFAFTGGYKIPLVHTKHMAYIEDEKDISITPTFHYKSQGKSDQLDIGLYGQYDQAIVGVWYRGIPIKEYKSGLQNNESLVVLLGWKFNGFSFGYSYDFTISTLSTARSGGSHEFNITYVYKKKKKYKPMRRLPCPSFYKH